MLLQLKVVINIINVNRGGKVILILNKVYLVNNPVYISLFI